MSTQHATSVHARRDEGDALWWGDGLAVLKVTGNETGGQLSLIEITEPPGYEAPLHVHHNEDEVPRGVQHGYRVGPHGCRLLFVLTPSGFEDVVRAIGVPASARTLATETQRPADPKRARATAAAHGVVMVDG